MAITKEEAVQRARADLAGRLNVSADQITEQSVDAADFPDMALGAPVNDEMSGQMISSGWRILLKARDSVYEYRADRRQLRLFNFNGANYQL